MKYAILSDIHANAVALEAALADAREQGAGKILGLGDLTGYGADPLAVVHRMREVADACVLGNHDDACVLAGNQPEEEVLAICNYDLDRGFGELISADDRAWLQSLPLVKTFKTFAITHGSFDDPPAFNYVFDEDERRAAFAACPEPQVLFVGHTHLAAAAMLDPEGHISNVEDMAVTDQGCAFTLKPGFRYLVNPGSVGCPRLIPVSSYVLYDETAKTVEFRNLPFVE